MKNAYKQAWAVINISKMCCSWLHRLELL